MLEKIISGGQTGADRGGLQAAKELGFVTGGAMPKGYRAEDYKGREVAELYNLREHGSAAYWPRTRWNVYTSDGTVLFGDMKSRGSDQTIQICREMEKPYIINPSKLDFLVFLHNNEIKILNVAGNRESKNPGLQERVYLFLKNALTDYGKREEVYSEGYRGSSQREKEER